MEPRGTTPWNPRDVGAQGDDPPEPPRCWRQELTMLPPRLVRRLVLAPLAIVIAVALAVLFPLLAVATWTFGLVGRSRPGRHRALRLLFFALVWLSAATRAFGLRIEIEEPELTATELAARLARPIIVLSRHAGPGDSLLLVHHLLSVYGRRPRVVMKASMQLDPGVDVVANRLPNVFIHHAKTGERLFVEQIHRLAAGLDAAGALVIFPEGGNWTPNRWQRGIARLEQLGRRDLAARAREMPNLLAPRSGGAFTAITACPAA